MKRLQIDDRELITALRRMAPETGSLICLGCGHERSCSTHGCAVLRMAVDRLAELTAPPHNPPLTLEELREMDGEPVWFVQSGYESRWYLVDCFWASKNVVYLRAAHGGPVLAETAFMSGARAYRRRPEEGTK